MLKIMHQIIVLNHIGFANDTIVQINDLPHRMTVFRFENHANPILFWLCCTHVLCWPSQQSPHLHFLQFIAAWRGLVVRLITATSRVVSNLVLYIIGRNKFIMNVHPKYLEELVWDIIIIRLILTIKSWSRLPLGPINMYSTKFLNNLETTY